MSKYAYVNGAIVPESEATVSVFDRGFLFADGVYEVTSVVNGKLVDNATHLERLNRSMSELSMQPSLTDTEIEQAQCALIEKNGLTEGTIYLQITRGVADRQFHFPKAAQATTVMFVQEKNLLEDKSADDGIHVITIPEIRWKRRDIKSVALLAQALGKQQAVEAGATEAFMVEDGYVTEGTSSNAYIVDESGTVISRQANTEILNGVTRRAVLALIGESEINFEQRAFTPEECQQAAEVFLTSASTFVQPVVNVNGHVIGDGRPGPVSKRLRQLYVKFAIEATQ